MSKIYKLEMYVIDHNDLYDCYDSISDVLENTTDLSRKVINESKVEFEWNDDLPINKIDCPLEEYDKYFRDSLGLELEKYYKEPQVLVKNENEIDPSEIKEEFYKLMSAPAKYFNIK